MSNVPVAGMINGMAGTFDVILIACDRSSTAAVSAGAVLPFLLILMRCSMQKIQSAVLLVCTFAVLSEIAGISLVAADESNRMILVSAGQDEKPPAETQTVFRPALSPDPAQKDKAEKRVTAKVYPYFEKLPRGEKCAIAIELTVQDGWHINANPKNPKFLIPTKVTLKTNPQLKIKLTRIKYPKHKLHAMQQEPEPYHVYDGKVMIYCLLEIDALERSDVANLEFSVRYQACNDEQCEKPTTVVMKGKMSLADPGDEIKKKYQDKFPQTAKPDAGT